MKLLWTSNAPWSPHGYGVQAGLITPRLVKQGHPVGVAANYGHEGAAMLWNGVTVFGKSYHPYAMDVLYGHARTFQAEAILTMVDLQVMDINALQGMPWIAWFPVDHQNIPPVIWEQVKNADFAVTMSKHADAEMDRTNKEHWYVPCAVDTQVYKPQDQATARTAMHLPQDKFIVGMVAHNKGIPSRKAFKANIAAFAALHKKHQDCVMYLHTQDGTRGFEVENLVSYCNALGLRVGYHFADSSNNADVIFADQYGLVNGYDFPMLAQLYASFDVLTAVTMGEGFGIPILEAQACGTPVIVGDWTSMPELCFSGWKVDKRDAEPMFTPMDAWQYLPHAGAIAEHMETAYNRTANAQEAMHDLAVKGAQAYDADKVVNRYWLPMLKEIENRLQQPLINTRLAQNLDVLR